MDIKVPVTDLETDWACNGHRYCPILNAVGFHHYRTFKFKLNFNLKTFYLSKERIEAKNRTLKETKASGGRSCDWKVIWESWACLYKTCYLCINSLKFIL